MNNETFTYDPENVTPPGETLRDVLEERKIDIHAFSKSTGISIGELNAIIEGKGEISPIISSKLERATGISKQFWIVRELNYLEYLYRINEYR